MQESHTGQHRTQNSSSYLTYKIIDNVFKVVVALGVAAILWLVGAVSVNDTRITRIEANRFTATDGQMIQRELMQELGQIRERLVAIESQLDRIDQDIQDTRE